MLVDFGKAGGIEKARQQPEKVRMALDKIRTDGVLPTVEAVFIKLDEPQADLAPLNVLLMLRLHVKMVIMCFFPVQGGTIYFLDTDVTLL